MITHESSIVFWDCSDSEELRYETKNEAIGVFLEPFIYPGRKDVPKQVTVKGFARMVPDAESLATVVLEFALERLDEEYNDPDGGWSKKTAGQEQAALTFVKAILEDYDAWNCEEIVSETIDTAFWISENRPDWLEDES